MLRTGCSEKKIDSANRAEGVTLQTESRPKILVAQTSFVSSCSYLIHLPKGSCSSNYSRISTIFRGVEGRRKLSSASITSSASSLSILRASFVESRWMTKIKHLQRPLCKVLKFIPRLYSSDQMVSALYNDCITIDLLLSTPITKSKSGNHLHLRILWKYKTIHSYQQLVVFAAATAKEFGNLL